MWLTMAPFCLVSAIAFFILNFSADRHISAESNESLDIDSDWKSAVRKIAELEKLVKVQEERISALEKRSTEAELKYASDLQKTVQVQNDRIRHLEKQVYKLEVQDQDKEIESIHAESPREVHMPDSEPTTIKPKMSLIRKERSFLQSVEVPAESIAFFAYFASPTSASATHHILAFDTVITNIGYAYHSHVGTFIAPRAGLYVFTWTIRMNHDNEHTTELVQNNNVVNSIYLYPKGIDGTITGTAVVYVNQGDDVFIRTGSRYITGGILSDGDGRSSFAGWSLL